MLKHPLRPRAKGARLAFIGQLGTTRMPKHIGQWTGLAVTTIVVLGCDIDVIYAVPLGILAGALATLFSTLADQRAAARNS